MRYSEFDQCTCLYGLTVDKATAPFYKDMTCQYQSFPYTTIGALFRKSTLLDRDFLNSAPGLYTENSGKQ